MNVLCISDQEMSLLKNQKRSFEGRKKKKSNICVGLWEKRSSSRDVACGLECCKKNESYNSPCGKLDPPNTESRFLCFQD